MGEKVLLMPLSRPLVIVHGGDHTNLPTFVKAHLEGLPCPTTLVHGLTPGIEGCPLLSQRWMNRAWRKAGRTIWRRPWNWEITKAYLEAFRRLSPIAVLAEWGTVAVGVMDACRISRVPLIAHFQGYEATVHSVLEEYRDKYQELFRESAAIIAVSRAMEHK